MEFKKVQKIIAEVLNVDESEITLDTSFVDDLGADSIDMFQIIEAIQDEFDIEVDYKELENISTVGEAIEKIKLNID